MQYSQENVSSDGILIRIVNTHGLQMQTTYWKHNSSYIFTTL